MKLEWTRKALKQLIKIQARDAKRIREEAKTLTDFPNCKHVRSLTNFKYDYRLRVGDYRVFFNVHTNVKIVKIEEVRKRDDKTYH